MSDSIGVRLAKRQPRVRVGPLFFKELGFREFAHGDLGGRKTGYFRFNLKSLGHLGGRRDLEEV